MYDFVTRVDRRDTGSMKWDDMVRRNPDVPAGVVPLSVADMEFLMAPEIRAALHEFVDGCVLGYTGPDEGYYEAVEGWFARRHGWAVQREWMVQTPGVVAALATAVHAFTRPGDGVVTMEPVYHPFRRVVESASRHVVDVDLLLRRDPATGRGRYGMDFDALEAACKLPDTKMLLLCSPHNPVGRVWTKDELGRVADICGRNGVFVCSDEIHADLVMPGYRHTVFADAAGGEFLENCMVCTAATKTFNLAGVQCSNVFIPNAERRERYVGQQAADSAWHGANAFAFPVYKAAYNLCEGWLDEAIRVIQSNHELVADFCAQRLPEAEVYPLEGTYLQWIDFGRLGIPDAELEDLMVRGASLFLDEGTMFGHGGSGFERVNIACPREVLLEALGRLADAVDALKARR